MALGERHSSDVVVLVLDPLLDSNLLGFSKFVTDVALLSLLLVISFKFKFRDELEILIVHHISLSRHGQVLESEVSLLVDMPVVVLADLHWDVVLVLALLDWAAVRLQTLGHQRRLAALSLLHSERPTSIEDRLLARSSV